MAMDEIRSTATDSTHSGIDPKEAEPPTYVVGIGASAGGLEALERLFHKMPADSGMAFVVVQHLSPDFDSVMDELLARHTEIPIHTVEDGMLLSRDAIYLIPPKKEVIISGEKLLLAERDLGESLSLPINTFFRSLAQEAGSRAIGIILSGTGSDGSRGCSRHPRSGRPGDRAERADGEVRRHAQKRHGDGLRGPRVGAGCDGRGAGQVRPTPGARETSPPRPKRRLSTKVR